VRRASFVFVRVGGTQSCRYSALASRRDGGKVEVMIVSCRNFTIAALTLWVVVAAPSHAGAEIQFNRDVRPILSENCFNCHGPDSATREADLRLDTEEGAMAAGIVEPGNAAASELIKRILTDDEDDLLPPPNSHKKLTGEEKKILAEWIDSGAKWQAHWAFITPLRPEVPLSNSGAADAQNPIDHFVAAKLTENGMTGNPPADKHTLARRAALDITGLPPTAEASEAFFADEKAGAFGRYVDALMATEQAGEHRARYWLDAARFGDTHGMHVDNYREMWPYRDWVIDAFNENMPFDQFIIEQLAGDLLPKPTLDQRIATGFSRCNITSSEGGAIPDELNTRYMIDRVETTSTVFLGLTTGCAACHDHKFAPISQKEFYSLGAFFNNTTQPPMDGNEKDTPPVVVLPDDELKPEWDALLARRAKLRTVLDHRMSQADLQKWWASLKPKSKSMGEHPIAVGDDLSLSAPLTEARKDQVALPENGKWADKHPAGKRGMRFDKASGAEVALAKRRSDEPMSISFWVRSPDQLLNTTIFEQMTKVDEAPKKDAAKDAKPKKHDLGWKLTGSTQGALTFTMSDGKGGAISGILAGEEGLAPKKWQHVCVRYSGGRSDTAISVVVNGENRRLRNSTQAYIDAVDLTDVPLLLGKSFPTGGLSDIRIFNRWLTGAEAQVLADEFKIREALAAGGEWSALRPAERTMLARYRSNALDPAFTKMSRDFAATQKRRDFIHSRSTTTLVMEERQDAEPRAWVLNRGEYDQRLDEVKPTVPAALIPLPENAQPNRLGLAQWLVDPAHPLTARVTVNRLWQSLFGVGLVKTAEDFGIMGERPSHPGLLDWLAVEFVESGWDVQHMLRLMMTSATYQQSSRATAGQHAADPDNILLGRGPRLRLDAEVLRDQILSVSGLLVPDIGGPSVKPYQPAGLWNVVAILGSNTRHFERDEGEALYRRSIYTFWKRTSPPPSMSAFDAPTREQCTVRRERTNTPLQALVLLNDPQYVEAARKLAEHTLKSGSKDDTARAAWMLKQALAQSVNKEDQNDIVDLVGDFRKLYAESPDDAKKLLETGDSAFDDSLDSAELAAWTMAANVLMNRDDFINKN